MDLAFIVSAYKNPDQLIRLLERLTGPNSHIFLHVDLKSGETFFNKVVTHFAQNDRIVHLERHECYWGDFGHVRATLKGIERILDLKLDVDYVILLTGQDYPLRRLSEIARFLSERPGKSYMAHFPLPDPQWDEAGVTRYRYRHYPLPAVYRFLPRPLRQLHTPIARAFSRLVRPLTGQHRFPEDIQPHGGSPYWCLTQGAVRYVHSFIGQRPDYVDFFKHVFVPDELFFHSILLSSSLRDGIVNENLWYIEWGRPTPPYPAILTCRDFSRIMRSGKLFGRKFDTRIDARVLDLIDRELGLQAE